MSEERTKPGLGFKPVSNLASIRTTLAIPDTVCEDPRSVQRKAHLTGEQLALRCLVQPCNRARRENLS